MKRFFLVFLLVCAASGCSYQSQQHILKEDMIGNSRILPGSKQAVYNAFLKTILLKNFIIKEEDASAGSILAERAVEKGRRTYIVSLQGRVFEETPDETSLFLNASERCERAFIRDNTRFFLFIIPLPGGGGKEASSMVESFKAIRDSKFYDEVFMMVKSNIVAVAKTVSPEAPISVVIEPDPVLNAEDTNVASEPGIPTAGDL